MNTALITGSSGFLGSNLSAKLIKKKFKVIGIDNFSTGLKKNTDTLMQLAGKQFQFIEADISKDWSFLKSIPEDCLKSLKYVFHFASPASPIHYQRLALETMWANSIGLSRAIEFADTYSAKVIFASSSEVYGDPKESPQTENYWGHVNSFGERSCYDESKRFGESLIYSHNKKNKTNHGLVRIFNTYGPGMNPNDGRVIINFVQQALKNEPLTIYGDGLQTRSFCYVDDLLNGIEAYALADITYPVNLGSENEITILQLAHTIIKTLNSNSIIIHKNLPSDDPKFRQPDLTLSRKLFKKWSKNISLTDGILNTAKSLN
ncbi:MAG: NAD-dependent epimerase/dehydratase family protein [Pseudobdellovibrio sp.]